MYDMSENSEVQVLTSTESQKVLLHMKSERINWKKQGAQRNKLDLPRSQVQWAQPSQ